MSIGDKPIGARASHSHPQSQVTNDEQPGINYREWLIGQIASGFAAQSMGAIFSDDGKMFAEHISNHAINGADAIIKRLDDEQGN